MRSRVALLFAVFVLTSAGSARAETLPAVEIPQDRSLSVEQYVARGLPELGEQWGPEEVARAARLFAELASTEPTQLPRQGSERSGVVFERVLAESLTFGGLGGGAPSASLQSYAFDPLVGLLFDRELVAIRRAIAEASLRVVHESVAARSEVDEWVAGAKRDGSAGSVDRLRGIGESQDRIRDAYGGRLLEAIEGLVSLCELDAASDEARAQARSHAERILLAAEPVMTPAGAASAAALRERLRRDPGCPAPASVEP